MSPEVLRQRFPHVILHVGQHKTGSKALQTALYANREWLVTRGLDYPIATDGSRALRPYEMNHHTLFQSVRDTIDQGADGLSDARIHEAVRETLSVASSAAPTVILSAEDLFDMHTAHEDAFDAERVPAGANLLARALLHMAASVRVVVYLRRQDHLLAAHYAQFIKGTNTNDLTIDAFLERFRPRLDSEAFVAVWEQAFGQDAVTVAPYEPAMMPGGIVADFFSRVVHDEQPPVPVPWPDDLEAFNITPSRDWLDFLRLLNRRTSRGLPALPRAAVLEAAFRDRSVQPAGISAWCSPGERAALVEAFAPGNRRIAERHGFGPNLFQEPRPHEGDQWLPPEPLSIARLKDLEARVRAIMTTSHSTHRLLAKPGTMTDSVDLQGILRD